VRKAVRWLKRFGWSDAEISQILSEGKRLPARELTWFKLWVFDRLRLYGLTVGEARKVCGLSKKALTEYRWILRLPDVFDILIAQNELL